MVGDISGKSWGSSGPSGGNSSGVGIVNQSPNLFGDLVSSALGQGKSNSNSNVPLKNSNSTSNSSSKNLYSMGNLADSLPKSTGNWGTSGGYNNRSGSSNINANIYNSKSQNLGGPSMKGMAGGAGGIGGGSVNGSKDPFGWTIEDDAFGDFQNVPKPSTNTFPSSGFGSSNNDFMWSNMELRSCFRSMHYSQRWEDFLWVRIKSAIR